MKKNVRRGFTLPEILVTVTVIAVLAAVVVPTVLQYVSKGDGPSVMAEIDAIKKGMIGFTADTRQYPGSLQQLTTKITSGGTCPDVANALNCALSSTTAYTPSQTDLFKGPYFEGTVSTTAAAPYATKALGVQFATKFVKCGTSSAFICLLVTVPSDSVGVANLDKAIDGGDGALNGNLIFTAAGTPGPVYYKLGVAN